jgi:hypothetical protein
MEKIKNKVFAELIAVMLLSYLIKQAYVTAIRVKGSFHEHQAA